MARPRTLNKNLPARMFARKGRRWTTYYFIHESGKWENLGRDMKAALLRYADLAQEEKAPLSEKTFWLVADKYLREIVPTKAERTQKDNKKELDKLLHVFGKVPLPNIRPVHIRKYLDMREAKVRGNREIALMSHIWNFARERGLTDLPNPCAGVRKHSEKGRDVYVLDEVYMAVYEAGTPGLRDAMDLAYLTGQRPADTLRMAETDIRDDAIEVKQGKTGAKVRITLEGELKALIDKIQARKKALTTIRVLQLITDENGRPMTQAQLRGRFDKARENAAAKADEEGNAQLAPAIREFQFRDLRAKAGTDKTEATGDIRQAQQQLGHTTIAMTEHYVRKRRGHKTTPTK